MKVGLSTGCFASTLETEEAITTIQSMGIDCAEVFFSTFYEYRPEFSREIAPKLKGIEINSVHTLTTNFEPQLFHSSRRVRGDALYWTDQLMRSAQFLQCKKWTLHGFHRIHGDGLERTMVERMNYLMEFTARFGVEVCLENVCWAIFNRPQIFATLKAECPNLRGVLDLKQARRSGYPWQMYAKAMAGSLAYTHLSDMDENGNICLPGKGIYNFEEILKVLLDDGFDGNCIIEVYRSNYQEQEELKQSVEYLQEILYKLGAKQ